MGGRGRAAAGLLVAFGACVALGLVLARTASDAWTALSSSPAPRPDDAISLLAALAGTALAGWLALGILLSVLGAAGRAGRLGVAVSGRLIGAVTPRVVQRAAATAVGLSVVAAPVAHAAPLGPTATARPGPAVTASVLAVDPGWGRAPVPATTAPPPGPVRREVVVVRRGDSLWRLAASALPEGASNRQVADTWPRWYAANRALIGADPDHLEPGQRLVAPPPSPADLTPGSPS